MASFFREWKRENSIPFTNANGDLASTTEKKILKDSSQMYDDDGICCSVNFLSERSHGMYK